MAAAIALVIFKLWELYEGRASRQFASNPRRTPLPANPQYTSDDVSIIIPTIDTPEALVDVLCSQLITKPREIVIVTIPRYLDHVTKLVSKVDDPDNKITVLTVDGANKRRQMVRGIQETSGTVLCLVDDDTLWPTPAVLPHLLAGLEDPAVGGVVGGQVANIRLHRIADDGLTMWEVAAIRALDNHAAMQNLRFAADGGCFCLVGRTALIRGNILRDPDFQLEFMNEKWMGTLLNSGDDAFITRWLMARSWRFNVQSAPEAIVMTAVMEDSRFLKQLVRWRRNGVIYFIKAFFSDPGLKKLYSDYPYCTGRKLKAVLQPLWTWVHIWAWVQTLCTATGWGWVIPVILIIWYLKSEYTKYRAFAVKFPYCGGRKIAGAWLLDNAFIFLDLYVYATIGTNSWMTRSGAK